MSTDYDKDAWRQHRVPTFIDLEDTVFGGLSWPQIVGVVISALTGFGVYMVLGAAPALVRFMTAGIVGLVLCGMIGIRPGGRSLYILMWEWISFKLGPRYFGDEVQRLVSRGVMAEADRRRGKGGVQVRLRLTLIGRTLWINFFLRIPLKQKRSQISIGGLVAFVLAASVITGCSPEKAAAQVPEEYAGKRVYLQSVVTRLDYNISTGGRSATLAVKAAAALAAAAVRVNENILSVYELNANRTRVLAATDKTTASAIDPVSALETGEEFSFGRIYLADEHDTRPFCDIYLGPDGFYLNPDIANPNYRFRYHSKDCRIRPSGQTGGDALSPEDTISKPFISVNWIDRKQNQGALSIEKSMLPYPDPHIEEITLETVDVNGGEILNINEMCNMSDVRVISLGIQSERPASPPMPDYFDGHSGQRIAGEIRTCPLEPAYRIARVILPDMPVFAAGVTGYEIRLRPYAETVNPEDVVSSAVVRVLDGNGAVRFEGPVLRNGDAGYDPVRPNVVKFNIAPPYIEPKTYSTDLDSITLQFEVEVEHVVKAIRPVHQPIQYFAEHGVRHIWQCQCSCSGGGCSSTCRSRSCSPSENPRRMYYKYWDPHFRVDEADREYLPTDPTAEFAMVFKQTMLFERMKFTFDRPFEEFTYVTPTPEPGELREREYYSDGDTIGLWDGEPLICSNGVAQDAEGRWTGWKWVEPGVNSLGEAYGGCRRAYGCKLHIPAVEEPFGPGGSPAEEDYECVKQR